MANSQNSANRYRHVPLTRDDPDIDNAVSRIFAHANASGDRRESKHSMCTNNPEVDIEHAFESVYYDDIDADAEPEYALSSVCAAFWSKTSWLFVAKGVSLRNIVTATSDAHRAIHQIAGDDAIQYTEAFITQMCPVALRRALLSQSW